MKANVRTLLMQAGARGLLFFLPAMTGLAARLDILLASEQMSDVTSRQRVWNFARASRRAWRANLPFPCSRLSLVTHSQGPVESQKGRAAGAGEISPEQRADIYMARKAYAEAVEYYLRALKHGGPSSATLWNKLGIAYQQQSDYRGARKAYSQAIHRRKDFPEPWNNLGTVYYLQNHYRKSVKYYAQAIRLSPNSASFHLNLGTSYYHLRKIKATVDEYRRALELDPNCLTQHSATGTILEARGADVDFYFYLAKVFASLSRTQEAVRYLRRAFEDGLQDHEKVEQDPDLQKISHEPAFVELMKNPPPAIKD